jgi:uncharacterized small protein (DUF1192 family)
LPLVVVRKRPTLTSFHPTPPGSSSLLQVSISSEEVHVEGFVKLNGRKALEDLKAHRRRLADELKSLNGVLDLSSSIKLLEDEIAVIDAGRAKLNMAAAA